MSRLLTNKSALSLSLWFGAVYDWILAAAIFFATPGFMAMVGFPPPGDDFLFRLTALPPLMFPVVYVAAAWDPAGRPWAVLASIQLRFVGGMVLLSLALLHHPPGFDVYLKVAWFDIFLGIVHLVLTKKNPPAQGNVDG